MPPTGEEEKSAFPEAGEECLTVGREVFAQAGRRARESLPSRKQGGAESRD